jgi:hypothetical protein
LCNTFNTGTLKKRKIGLKMLKGTRSRAGKNTSRAYVRVKTRQGCPETLFSNIARNSGVVVADVIEGQSDVILVLEASNREELANTVMDALAALEPMTEDVELLPVRAKVNSIRKSK